MPEVTFKQLEKVLGSYDEDIFNLLLAHEDPLTAASLYKTLTETQLMNPENWEFTKNNTKLLCDAINGLNNHGLLNQETFDLVKNTADPGVAALIYIKLSNTGLLKHWAKLQDRLTVETWDGLCLLGYSKKLNEDSINKIITNGGYFTVTLALLEATNLVTATNRAAEHSVKSFGDPKGLCLLVHYLWSYKLLNENNLNTAFRLITLMKNNPAAVREHGVIYYERRDRPSQKSLDDYLAKFIKADEDRRYTQAAAAGLFSSKGLPPEIGDKIGGFLDPKSGRNMAQATKSVHQTAEQERDKGDRKTPKPGSGR